MAVRDKKEGSPLYDLRKEIESQYPELLPETKKSRYVSTITTIEEIEKLSEYGIDRSFIDSMIEDFNSEDIVGR